MACNIIDPRHVKLNGGNSVYGGAITNFSMNFAGLSSQIKATATLVQKTTLSTPGPEGITVELNGKNFKMQVGGYSFSSSATGPTTCTLNLYDTSNKYLDRNHIALQEEFPGEGPNVNVIGLKYGTLPNTWLVDMGILNQDADTQWGEVRSYFEHVQDLLKLTPFSRQLSNNEVDFHVNQTQGKTLWWTNYDPKGGTTLNEALGNLLAQGSRLPDGRFDFKGTYREVLVNLCNTVGMTAFWDMEKEKVVLNSQISTADGFAKLQTLRSTCEVTAAGNSADFTTTWAKGACGTFNSSYQGENQSAKGGEISRTYYATRLNPTFHYKACRHKGSGLLTELNLEAPDTLLAIQAAVDGEIFALYALQSMLAANAGQTWDAGLPVEVQAMGQGNEKNKKVEALQEAFQATFGTPYTQNSLLADYYAMEAGEEGEEDRICSGKVYPFTFAQTKSADETKMPSASYNAQTLAKGWNEKTDKFPANNCGTYAGGLFSRGTLFVQEGLGNDGIAGGEGITNVYFSSILADSGVESGDDMLRQYLLAIYNFRARFYIIKDGGRLRSVNVGGRDYGYYITSSANKSAINLEPPEGMGNADAHPFLSLTDCKNSEIQMLAKTCAAMYLSEGQSLDNVMDNLAVIDFLYAVERDKLTELFTNVGAVKKATPMRAVDIENDPNPSLRLHFFVVNALDKLAEADIFKVNRVMTRAPRGNAGNLTEIQVQPLIKKIAKGAVGKLPLSGGKSKVTTLQEAFAQPADSETGNRGALWVCSNENIGSYLTPATLPEIGPFKAKATFNDKASMGGLFVEPSEFFLADAVQPPSSGVWKTKIDYGVSVNAADVGQSNQQYNKWTATMANEGHLYSVSNRNTMKRVLREKVQGSAWAESANGASQTLSILLTDDSDPVLPGWNEGLESLSISNSSGRSSISVTVGNTLERQAKQKMFELAAQSPHAMYRPINIIPDTFTGGASPRFVSTMQGFNIS